MNNPVIIMCPPYPLYEEAPDDQPESELFDCPKCKGKMWLSQKKKGVLLFIICCREKEIILACYSCITKYAHENPSFVLDSEMVRI